MWCCWKPARNDRGIGPSQETIISASRGHFEHVDTKPTATHQESQSSTGLRWKVVTHDSTSHLSSNDGNPFACVRQCR